VKHVNADDIGHTNNVKPDHSSMKYFISTTLIALAFISCQSTSKVTAQEVPRTDMSKVVADSVQSSIHADLTTTGIHTSYGISFNSDYTEILPISDITMKQIADFMIEKGASFTINVHSDNVGDRNELWDRTNSQASLIRRTLVSQFKVDTNQLASTGYGGRHPIADNSTSEGRATNNRVDIVISSAMQNYIEKLFEGL